ncbi:MAG: hypothetical protein AAFY05_12870 [Pseudomonadota bacterium]
MKIIPLKRPVRIAASKKLSVFMNTLALLAGGLGVLGLAGWRRKHAAA